MNPGSMSEAAIVGYCRACGKGLAEGEVYRAQGAMYCKSHAPMEQAGPSPYTASPYSSSPYNAPPAGTAMGSGISPGVAFVLGFIPGVGAIYNGQYAKGLIHVLVIGLAISALSSDELNGFGPLIALMMVAFWIYMPFDAYHVAQARLSGQAVDSGVPGGAGNFPAAAVILIALGTALLLNNLGIFELRRALRYWPVLLIGAGVYMLVDRFSTRGDPVSKPGDTKLVDSK